MATPSAGRGQTWSAAEISCLLAVWAEDFINAQLSTTHKNSDIYAIFSKRLRAKGYSRSITQCRIKAKKLRADYIKTRDALSKSGADGSIKDKFPWYEQMDSILGTKPIVDPVDVVDNEDRSPASSSSTDTATTDAGSHEENSASLPADDQSTAPSTSTESADTNAETQGLSKQPEEGGRLRIPGARARKRKCKTSRTDSDFQNYMEEIQQRIEESNTSEQRQDNMFKELMQAQLDAEERRFRESQEAKERRYRDMQEQQLATTQMFTQLLGSIASLCPEQPSSSHHWPRPHPAPPSSTWSTQHQHQNQPSSLNPPYQQNPQHRRPEESTSTSSLLHGLNHIPDYQNLLLL